MLLTFGRASKQDVPALIQLYEEAFGSAAEARLVFEAVPERLCFCAWQGGAPCAMTFALPVQIQCGAQQISAAYLFAVATARQARGQGISTALLEQIRQTLSAEGVRVLLLRPASESLADFYAARGYRYISKLARADASLAAPLPDTGLWELFPREYCEMRTELLRGADYIAWDVLMLEVQHRFLGLYGGGYCALGSAGKTWGCAAYYMADGVLDIQELLAPPERIGAAVAAFEEKFAPSRMTVRLESRRAACLGLSPQDFLMARWDAPELDRIIGVYAALVMD